MPTAPLALCLEPGCPNRVRSGRCAEHETQIRRESDARRSGGRQRGWTREWAAFSKDYLRRHPMCECDECAAQPAWRRHIATDVDHTGGHSRTCPHALDERHVQALSHPHHASKTAREDGGFGNASTATRCTDRR